MDEMNSATAHLGILGTAIEQAVTRAVAQALRQQPVAEDAPYLVAMAEAGRLLGGVSRDTVEELLARNDLRSVAIGRRRLVVRASIAAYVARQAAADLQ